MSTAEDDEVDFIIVRLVSYVCSPPSFPWRTRILISLHYRGSKIYRMEEDESLRRKYRTDCWLEQCIYEERICAPDEQVSFIPLDITLPVAGPSNVPYFSKCRADTGVCSRGGRHYYLDLWIRTIRGPWTKASIPSSCRNISGCPFILSVHVVFFFQVSLWPPPSPDIPLISYALLVSASNSRKRVNGKFRLSMYSGLRRWRRRARYRWSTISS